MKKAGVSVDLTKPGPSHKVRFNLERDGGLNLIARDEAGRVWYILQVQPDGTLYRYQGVPKDIGFQVDAYGRVRLEETD